MRHADPDDSAFPVMVDQGHCTSGMTMREWYAGQVLPVAAQQENGAAKAAAMAFEYADAMLAEAAKERPA